MIHCPRCQHKNEAEATFCDECGARLEEACPSCREPNRTGAKFCRRCGQGMVRPAAFSQTSPSKFSAPDSYTPKHLLERILTFKAALEGERKQVTVLFADLKGSMELLADRDPEEARKLLDPVLEHMMEAVHRYEGTVNQVMGDGIMALFGAPLAHEDHAVRACYAALRMQESVRRYADGVRRSDGLLLQIRVGLNSGEVVVRSIDSDLHMDYSAIGQTTHLAARMEQMAAPGSILIPPETLRLAEDYIQAKALGPMPVKGLPAPIEIYEVTGASPVRSRLQAASVRGLTRFVGRDVEMTELRQALDRARDGHGQVVALVGEPGVGKSRLFWELTHSHGIQAASMASTSAGLGGWRVLESGAVSYGKSTPYRPVIELLRGYFAIESQDDGRSIREKVTGKVLALDRALEPALPALLALLEVPPPDGEWDRLEPLQRRYRTQDGVKHLLLRESQVQPLLLIVEDLHWMDAESQALLDALVDSMGAARFLLLVNYRPEYSHGWSGKTNYRQLRVDPLPPENTEDLLDSALGTDPSLVPLRRLLIERTQGNPFFLEESVRALVETSVLTGERGSYRLSGPVGSLQVPASVQAILAARIDRLVPEDKRLLQAAAVIGKDVPWALLDAIGGVPDSELRAGLARLQAADLLLEARLFPDLEYTFRHALTHDVAYESLLRDRRRSLHAAVVAAIEKLHGDRLVEHVEALAHHAVRGELWEKAAAYLQRVGAKASARPAHREAVTWYEQALAALARLTPTTETLQQCVDVHLALGTDLILLDEFTRILPHLREAEACARASGDRQRIAMVASSIAHWHFVQGSGYERIIEWGEEALGLADDADDAGLRAVICMYLGYAWLGLGDYQQAARFLRSNIERLTGDLVRVHWGRAVLPSAICREVLARCLAELGEFEEGLRHAEEAVSLAEAHLPATLGQVSYGLGYLQMRRGEPKSAIHALERGLTSARRWNTLLLIPYLASALGEAYLMIGRLAEALPLLEEGAASERVARSLRLARLGEGYLRAGRLEEARETAQRALDAARGAKERGYAAWTLYLLGEIAAGGHPATAEARYRDALDIATALQMRPLLARCHFGLGELCHHTGRRAQAAEHLSQAAVAFEEMGMQSWLSRARDEDLSP